jgi:hypothetical protein
MKKLKRNYLVKVNGERYETISIRRFLNHVRTIKWEKHPSVYLRVSYGMKPDVFGKMQTFYNDGNYTDSKEFVIALQAFFEL